MATLAELLEHHDRLVIEIAEGGGVTEITTEGGESVRIDKAKQLALIRAEINRLQATAGSVVSLMSHVKLVSQGAG